MRDREDPDDRSQEPGTALARHEGVGGLLRPVAPPEEILQAQEETRALVAKTLTAGRDFGIIPGTRRPTLLKPGGERINAAFGVMPRYRVVEKEIDHDRPVTWTKRQKRQGRGGSVTWETVSGTSVGLYRYVVECALIHRESGVPVGHGLASCSTLESKYVDRPRECENTVLKMAEKRALIAATLNAYGLSDQFADEDGGDHEIPSAGDGYACPRCGSPMRDQRATKKNPRAPDFKCTRKGCGHGVWTREEKAPEPTPPEGFTPPAAVPPEELEEMAGDARLEEVDDDLPF